MMVGSASVTTSGRYDYYQVDVPNVPAGSYEIYARSRLASGAVESMHVPITVVDVGTRSGPTMNLSSDLVLSGSTNFELIGTPGAPINRSEEHTSELQSLAYLVCR